MASPPSPCCDTQPQWWLRSYPVEQPLFMQVGFPGPHPPYDPVPRWLERYVDKEIPLREYTSEEIAAQPEPMLALRRHMIEVDHDSVVHLDAPTRAQRHYQRACYLANVSMIDEEVGGIMEALATQGLLDDTVVVFASDHGDSLGDHGHSQKWNMYEETVRVPAIVWMGERARAELGADAPARDGAAAQGRRLDALVSLFDLGPTMLELAGVAPPADMEAVSLAPLLGVGRSQGRAAAEGSTSDRAAGGSGEAVAVSDATWDVPTTRPVFVDEDGSRRYVFAEHGRDNILEGTAVMTMIRDERWKLVTYSGTDEGQLFDLASDPDERTNLWSEAAVAHEKRRLLDALHTWYRESLYQTRTRRRR